MARPYRRLGAAELAALFEELKTTSPSKLSDLRAELLQRSTQKATDLLAKVDNFLATAKPRPETLTSEPQQLDLVLPNGRVEPVAPRPPPEILTPPKATRLPPKATPAEKRKADALVVDGQMSEVDAAKALGVAANAPWEVIEKARQELVRKALSAQDIAENLKLVSRVNLAYLSLAMARCF